MSVQFHPNGVVTVDTVDEAILFEAKRGTPAKRPKSKTTHKGPIQPGWTGFRDSVLGPAGRNARKVMALVQGSGAAGVTVTSLAKTIGADHMVIVGTITGIRQRALAAKLEPDDILVRAPDGTYRVGKLLAEQGAPMP